MRKTFQYRRRHMEITFYSERIEKETSMYKTHESLTRLVGFSERRTMNNTTKINVLAYASEPDKNYDYDGDFVEYNGKVYWVCLRDELVEFVRNAKKKEV